MNAKARPKRATKKRTARQTGRTKRVGPATFAGMSHSARAQKIIAILKREYPDARCQLDHRSAFELLIATILAAQCTDEMVNRVTPALFDKFPDAQSFADASAPDIEQMIFKTGFYRNKTRSIQNCCRALIERHGGNVPQTMEELTTLAGVGRKTANCVLGNVFGVPGIVVDTHVKRISYRMGLTAESNPDKIEMELVQLIPEGDSIVFSHLIGSHGRTYCMARKPDCESCPVAHLCPKIFG